MPSFVSQVNYQRMAETIAIPPSSPSPAPAANPGKRFEGEGLPFKAKLIGMEDLNVDRDEKVCLDSMFKLKAVVKARGEHKQRIQLNLTINGVKLTDDTTKVLIANHEIERISFVVIDPRDTRAFGYIYNTTDDRHQFWAIKTEKSAAATVLAMKDLFDYAFEIYNDPKNKTETPSSPAKTVDPEPTPAPAPAPAPAPVPTTADVFNTPVVVDEPKPAPVVERKEESIIDIFGSDDLPVLNPSATTSHAGLIQPLWDEPEPVPVPAPAPPSASIDPLEDLFNNLASPSAPLTNPVLPISNSLFNPSAQMNVMSPSITPTPLFPSTTTSNPPLFPSISTPSVNSFPTSPTSPVAPPTVLNPLLDLDIFGGAGTGKTTKDAFFPTQPAKQPLAQMQNERRA